MCTDWEHAMVGEIGQVQLGRQRSPATDSGSYMVPYLRVANVYDGFIDYSNTYSMNFSPAEQERYFLERGDILLNEGQSLELVGRSAIFTGPSRTYCFQNTLVRFRAGHRTLSGFARAIFKRWLDIGHFTTIAKQTTSVAHLGANRFACLRFPLAPLPEQQKIAEVLDTVDEAIRKTEAILAKLKQVKQGLLHDLLTRGIDDNGELRDPERHPEQFKDSPLGRIPKGWRRGRLGDEAEVFNGTTPSRALDCYWGGTVPWLSSGKVNDYRIVTPSEHITDLALSETSLRVVPRGSVVVGLIGQGKTRGMTARTEIDTTINQNLCAIIPHPEVSGVYLHLFLHYHYQKLRGGGRGSNQDALNCGLVREFPIVVPPLEEQESIADAIESFEARYEHEEEVISKLKELKSGLMEDLLTGRVRVTPLLEGAPR